MELYLARPARLEEIRRNISLRGNQEKHFPYLFISCPCWELDLISGICKKKWNMMQMSSVVVVKSYVIRSLCIYRQELVLVNFSLCTVFDIYNLSGFLFFPVPLGQAATIFFLCPFVSHFAVFFPPRVFQ